MNDADYAADNALMKIVSRNTREELERKFPGITAALAMRETDDDRPWRAAAPTIVPIGAKRCTKLIKLYDRAILRLGVRNGSRQYRGATRPVGQSDGLELDVA
jgi:hypothetical protein